MGAEQFMDEAGRLLDWALRPHPASSCFLAWLCPPGVGGSCLKFAVPLNACRAGGRELWGRKPHELHRVGYKTSRGCDALCHNGQMNHFCLGTLFSLPVPKPQGSCALPSLPFPAKASSLSRRGMEGVNLTAVQGQSRRGVKL